MGAETKGNLDYLTKIPEIKFTKLFINGEFVDSVSGFPIPPCFLFLSKTRDVEFGFLFSFSSHRSSIVHLKISSHY